jgi:hypothetical protein
LDTDSIDVFRQLDVVEASESRFRRGGVDSVSAKIVVQLNGTTGRSWYRQNHVSGHGLMSQFMALPLKLVVFAFQRKIECPACSCWWTSISILVKLFVNLDRLSCSEGKQGMKWENGANPLQGRCCDRPGPGHHKPL